MAFLGPFGSVETTIPNGQSIIVSSYGPGGARVLYGKGTNPTIYYLQSSISGGSTLLAAVAADTPVRVESAGWAVEYAIGAAPVLSGKLSTQNGLTAKAGGGQSGATALNAEINRVTTVATGADSCVLPSAAVGMKVTVINAAAANAMNVFPASGEAINALANDTAISVVANKTITFYCALAGKWNSILTA